jgi:hypothetical protein
MSNDEVIPEGYQVHPAFKYEEGGHEVNIPGFWVAKYNISNMVDCLFNSSGPNSGTTCADLCTLDSLHGELDASLVKSRLLKNTEWAAVAYLSMYTVGRCDEGMSLNPNNSSGVMELDVKCFVAGGLRTAFGDTEARLNYADKYKSGSGDKLTYISYEDSNKKYGDAMIATSSLNSSESSWFGGTSIMPTSDAPYIMRGLDGNLFSYTSTERNPDRGAACRNVLIINPD